jgi:tRNA threonylcarbamoyladenosine biosynthesis protein TsaE
MKLPATIISHSPEQTMEIAGQIAIEFPTALILLHGQLGVGKTLFAKGFARGLEITDNVSSPSYTLMNEYRSERSCLYHLDLYRINCFEEVVDIGLFEILDAGKPCLVEWAERVAELQKLPHLDVNIACPPDGGNDTRIISWIWQGEAA